MTPRRLAIVASVYAGSARDRWPGKPPSAIHKTRIDGPAQLTPTGLACDEQADHAVHGGPEKALHHYPAEHYDAWAETFPKAAAAYTAGAFGENLSTRGLVEADLCVGDVLAVGSDVVVQVAQGRQPCWKLAAHMGQADLAYRVQKTGRTGWYYRVLASGAVVAGDSIVLRERPCPEWPLDQVIAARFAPKLDPSTAAALSELPQLAEAWRTAFAQKRDPAFEEDASRRLQGPKS